MPEKERGKKKEKKEKQAKGGGGEKQVKQRGKKEKSCIWKLVYTNGTPMSIWKALNTRKKINLCFSSSAKNLTQLENMTLKIGSGRESFKGCGCQCFITKWKAFQGGPKGSGLNLILLNNYLNDKTERICLFSLLLGNTSALLGKIKTQNDQKIPEMVRITLSHMSAENRVLTGSEKCNPNSTQP